MRAGLKFSDWSLYHKRKDTETHREDGRVAVETDRIDKVRMPREASSHQKAEGGKEGFFTRAFKGSMVLPTA